MFLYPEDPDEEYGGGDPEEDVDGEEDELGHTGGRDQVTFVNLNIDK